jgi:hypothetical protein
VPVRAAAALLAALARGVHYLHDHYLLHRDIKPSNILLGPAPAGALPDPDLAGVGMPRLTDFGLAKLLDATQTAAPGATTGGLLVGTAEYMAPEQADGRPERLGRPADVYALGAVLYELLVRRPPFRGRNRFDTLRLAQTEEPAHPRRLRPDVPRDLEAVCLRALARDPQRRYATAGEMAEDLQRFLAGQPTQTRPTSWWRRTLAWARRRPTATAVTLTAAAAVLALVVTLAAADRSQRRERADHLYQALWTTDLAELGPVVEQLRDYLPFVADDLRPRAAPDNTNAAARLRAALVLADRDGPAARHLEERIDDATPAELHLICTVLRGRREVVARLEAGLDERDAKEPAEPAVRRRANRALALACFGRTGPALDGLRAQPDPRLRYHLLHGFGPCRVDPAVLAAELGSADDAVRAALLLALGDYTPGAIPDPLPASLRDRAAALLRDDPDPGVHSAAEWLLRRWGAEATPVRLSFGEALARKARWCTTEEGQTLALIGFPPDAARAPGGAALAPFALATTEVTVEQFLRFRPGHAYQHTASPEPSCPVNDVTFALAAAYCNWLSEREEIPPAEHCYKLSGEPDDPETKVVPVAQGRGYRLPTEAEWEHACRAGTTTAHFFGESAEHLPRYAWFARNSDLHNWPVGQLRPNPLGLFDVYGNVLEWCARDADFLPEDNHAFRGGGARNKEDFQQSTTRQEVHPTYFHEHLGFRVARTLPDGPAAEPPARGP